MPATVEESLLERIEWRVVWEMAAGDDGTTKAVGPYLLQRTLGKGQTGRRLVGL